MSLAFDRNYLTLVGRGLGTEPRKPLRSRGNTKTRNALCQEFWDLLRRTIHAAKYLSDPQYRRKISRQLNKGESLHALRRDLHYANQGIIGKPYLQQQTEQAWCLTVMTNAVVTWTTEYYSLAVTQPRSTRSPRESLNNSSPRTPLQYHRRTLWFGPWTSIPGPITTRSTASGTSWVR